MKAKVIEANPKLLDVINVVRTRSSDSTESAHSLAKAASPLLSSAVGAVAHALDWRNKEETSIFRSRSDVSDIPDMLTIKRCNAFDDDEDDDESDNYEE